MDMTSIRYNLLILDFDGTMCDTRSLITDTMSQTIRSLHLDERSREECAKTIGLPLVECFIALYPGMTERMGQLCADTYREFFKLNNRPGKVSPFPGVVDTIRELHAKGVRVTIASSRGHHSVKDFAVELGLDDIITFMLGGDDVPQAKPAPDPVLLTLAHCQAAVGEALVVGDTKYDILMGKNAGVATCGVTYGNGGVEELQVAGAEYIINRFGDLLDIVLG